MKIKQLFTYILLQSLFFVSCSQKINCDQLSQNFTSYEKALTEIKSAQFKIKESVNTSKSSWIENASYYSCNGETGFFIFETAKKEYLYTSMPYSIWLEFKNAESLGSYYNDKIKHNYIFTLSK